jgi:hypothetical protein
VSETASMRLLRRSGMLLDAMARGRLLAPLPVRARSAAQAAAAGRATSRHGRAELELGHARMAALVAVGRVLSTTQCARDRDFARKANLENVRLAIGLPRFWLGAECTSKPDRPSPTHSAKSLSALSRSLDRNGRASSPQRQRQLAQMQTGIVLQRTGSGALESTSSPQRQRQAAQMQTGIVLQRTSSGALESAGFAAAAADGASGINSSRSTDRSRRSGSPRAAVSLGAMRQIRADWEAMATETAATAKKVAQPPRMRQRLRRQQQEEEDAAAAAAAS